MDKNHTKKILKIEQNSKEKKIRKDKISKEEYLVINAKKKLKTKNNSQK